MSWTDERSNIANLSRWRPDDHAALSEARRDLRAERLAEAIRKTVAEAPPLSDEQRQRLAELLRAGSP